jgi:hypothetical protein
MHKQYLPAALGMTEPEFAAKLADLKARWTTRADEDVFLAFIEDLASSDPDFAKRAVLKRFLKVYRDHETLDMERVGKAI